MVGEVTAERMQKRIQEKHDTHLPDGTLEYITAIFYKCIFQVAAKYAEQAGGRSLFPLFPFHLPASVVGTTVTTLIKLHKRLVTHGGGKLALLDKSNFFKCTVHAQLVWCVHVFK